MPRTLYDDQSNPFEVPTDEEVAELKTAADTLKSMEEDNKGLKSLREALSRKEARERELLGELEKAKTGTVEVKPLSAEEATSIARREASKTLLDAEISRQVAKYTDDEKKVVRRYYDKLTVGEEVNTETLGTYMTEAIRAAGLERSVPSRVSHGGGAARVVEKGTSFADTDAGKAFAARVGFKTELPKKE